MYDDRREADQYLDWTRQWGREVVRALKPDGAFWLAIGDEYAAEMKVLFHRDLGLSLRSWVVWYYTFGVHCTKKFARSHAHLFYFVKDPKRFTFNIDDPGVRVPSARQLVYFDTRANPKGRLPDDTWILRPQDVPDGFAADGDTWYFPRVCGTFKERAGWHGCQMPEQLLGRIVRACSNEGETVLDPFGGSGTTLTVAKKQGRRFLGFELSPEYAAQIETRLGAARVGQALEGSDEPLAGGKGRAGAVEREQASGAALGRLTGERPARLLLILGPDRFQSARMRKPPDRLLASGRSRPVTHDEARPACVPTRSPGNPSVPSRPPPRCSRSPSRSPWATRPQGGAAPSGAS